MERRTLITSTAQTSSPKGNGMSRQGHSCKRCNERHVKCDASMVGIPCSNCKNTNKGDCTYIISKRKRGPTGQYVSSNDEQDNLAIPQISPKTHMTIESHPESPGTNISIKTARKAEFLLDLAKLYEEADQGSVIAEASPSSPPSSEAHIPADTVLSPADPDSESKASFFGESWYASFLLRASNNRHNQLHQRVTQNLPSEAVLDSNRATQQPIEDDRTVEGPNPVAIAPDIPPKIMRDSLIEAYFSRFHILFPILDKSSFLSSVRDGSISLTLLRCVLFVASFHCDIEICHRFGYETRIDAGDALFQAAKASFDAETKADRVLMLQCSFLLHYWWGKPTNFKDALWYLATSIRSVQGMGMHRSMRESRIPARTRSHWKRIWWCLYISDRQVSMGVGAPMIINDLDCDVEDLEMEDFENGSEEHAQYFIALANFSRIVSSIYFYHLSPSRLNLNINEEYRHNAQIEIASKLDTWFKDVPSPLMCDGKGSHHLALVLQIVYNYHMVIFYQRLQRMRPQNDTDSEDWRFIVEAASNVTRLVETALSNWGPEYLPMICVTALFAAMTAQYVDFQCSKGYKSQLSFQKLRSNLLSLQQFEQCYTLARWIGNLFKDIIEGPRTAPTQQRPDNPSEISPDYSQEVPDDGLDRHYLAMTPSSQYNTADGYHAPSKHVNRGSLQETTLFSPLSEGDSSGDAHANSQTSNPSRYPFNSDVWHLATRGYTSSPFQSANSSPLEPQEFQGRQFHPGLWFSGFDIG